MRKAIYEFKKESPFKLEYRDGELLFVTVLTSDKVMFDGIKHHIELFEFDLDKELFIRIS